MNRWLAPGLMVGTLLVIGGTLLVVIVLRPWAGPDRTWRTHLNLTDAPVQGYTRSVETVVTTEGSAPIVIWQPHRSVGALSPVEAGRVLFVAKGCANCHGLQARGAEVGPDLMDVSRSELRHKVRAGPDGMPAFHDSDLTDQEVDQIYEYIKYLQEHPELKAVEAERTSSAQDESP